MRIKDSTRNPACFKAAWKYFFDKGAYLLLINVLPSLLIPFALSPTGALKYLFSYKTIAPENFFDMLVKVYELPFEYWYIGIIGLVLFVFDIAIMLGVIDRHMRIGEFTVSPSRVKVRLNFNVLTALRFIVLAFVAFEILNLLSVALYYLWWELCKNHVGWLVLSSITHVALQLGMISIMARVILWPPYCLHTGMKAKDAFKQATKSISGRVIPTMLHIVLAILPVEIAMIITGALGAGVVAQFILDVIAYLYVVPFYLVLMYTLFYDVTGTERVDLERKEQSIWSKSKKRKK